MNYEHVPAKDQIENTHVLGYFIVMNSSEWVQNSERMCDKPQYSMKLLAKIFFFICIFIYSHFSNTSSVIAFSL